MSADYNMKEKSTQNEIKNAIVTQILFAMGLSPDT